jgi:nitroimidazol reductase NimA-like FMN-containing flavoprotein (pyridoxamine 5'-phosphate oxidase superfamily)
MRSGSIDGLTCSDAGAVSIGPVRRHYWRMRPKPAPDAPSAFTRVKRLGERGAYDRATIYAILDASPFCHVGHIINGRPVVIPTMHWRHGNTLYWHGSSASRMLEASPGEQVCLTATVFDAYVLARSGFNHSVNYRSVMCFGRPVALTDPAAKLAALEHFVERLFPGRWPTLRPPTAQEVKATSVLSMPIEEASAKLRTDGPHDNPEDLSWPVWAGLLALVPTRGDPIPDPDTPARLHPPAGWSPSGSLERTADPTER